MTQRMFYPVESENVNERNSMVFIAMQDSPGRTNMSGEERISGWLGTTDGHYREALGVVNEADARDLLRERDVKIPDDVPVRYTRYAVGGDEQAERYNNEFAYSYQGPWYDIPADETRWASAPRVVRDTRVVEMYGEPKTHLVILTPQPADAGKRMWYEVDFFGNRDAADEFAESIMGKTADTDRLSYYHSGR